MTTLPITTVTNLEISSSSNNDPYDALVLSHRTTAQRDKLRKAPGTLIYNSETNTFEGYVAGADNNTPGSWKKLAFVQE